jgi:hypothetical protein
MISRWNVLWRRVLGACLGLSCLNLVSAPAQAAEALHQGRGLYTFASAVGCPLPTLTPQPGHCNRVALDDAHSQVWVDEAAHVIRWRNSTVYPHKTVVGDVLLQGHGRAEDGRAVALSFHLVISRKGSAWSFNQHAHATAKGRFHEVQIDPWKVVVEDAKGEQQVAVTPQEVVHTVADPSWVTRVASELVQVRDNRTADSPTPDITIALGAGAIAKQVMRARLRSAGMPGQDAVKLLREGSWSVVLEPLTDHIPLAVTQRELFLYGLSDQPVLKPVMQRGFEKGETLEIGALRGEGYLRLGGDEVPFPGAASAARAFFQQSFVGLILGSQWAGEGTK